MGYGYGRNGDDYSRSDGDVAKSGSLDSGFCNPRKIKAADEARTEAISTLRGRGHSKSDAEKMIDDS